LEAKLCPECLSEFLATVEVCSDCGVPLVHPDEVGDDTDGEDLPAIGELVPIRVASIPWIQGLSELLQDAGVAHRVGPPPEPAEKAGAERRSHDLGMAVYVLPEDQQEAMRMDAEHLRAQIPEASEAEDHAPGNGGEGCPACGEAVSAEDQECSSCGLPFIEIEE
jgi:hypothetical protein